LVKDYVATDDPVRFIKAFVDDFDPDAAGIHRLRPKDTGLPSFEAAEMLKLYLYGHLNRVRSSRLESGGGT